MDTSFAVTAAVAIESFKSLPTTS